MSLEFLGCNTRAYVCVATLLIVEKSFLGGVIRLSESSL
jgi:hypothetical protein